MQHNLQASCSDILRPFGWTIPLIATCPPPLYSRCTSTGTGSSKLAVKGSAPPALTARTDMGEIILPRRMFLWCMAVIYLTAFVSLYVQIPGETLLISLCAYVCVYVSLLAENFIFLGFSAFHCVLTKKRLEVSDGSRHTAFPLHAHPANQLTLLATIYSLC